MTTARLIFGLLFLSMGVAAFTGFDIFHYFAPAILMFIGIRILLGRRILGYSSMKSSELHQDEVNEVAIFSGSEKEIVTSQFAGGKAVAIFSGMQLDLTKAKTKAKIMNLEVVAVFGGLKVIVPKDWRVTTDGAGVLGGFTNHTAGASDSAPRLHIKGAGVFGGVEIVN